MPSSEEETLLELSVSKEWLLRELRTDPDRLVILDCRSSNEYSECHIRHAVNFSIPSIMLRRLAAGKIDVLSTIKCRDLKSRIMSAYKGSVFVVYGDYVLSQQQQQQQQQQCCYSASDTLYVLAKRLAQDGCQVVCLEGGFTSFHALYPEWCDSVGGGDGVGVPLMGLRSLRISASSHHSKPQPPQHQQGSCGTSSADSSDCDERCDSSLGLDDGEDREFPVEILPHLFLGNAANSEDREALAKHSIQYILNVTPDLPNVFEDSGCIKYMQIPIADHWSQNLASFFPKAIEFIEEARSKEKGVLVHCLAGVSRSVTITVAYLMYKLSMNLNDAFNLVRSRKSNIAPNFHFMEQLHSFEQELALAVGVGGGVGVQGEAPSQMMTMMMMMASNSKTTATTCGDPATSLKKKKKKTTTTTDGEDDEGGGGDDDADDDNEKKDGCPTSTTPSCPPDCKCAAHFLSPLAVGTSPDSGIEFDRWTSSASGGE